MQEELPEQLLVDRSIVTKRLKYIEKISDIGRWMPMKLTASQPETPKINSIMNDRFKRKSSKPGIFTTYSRRTYYVNADQNCSFGDSGKSSNRLLGQIVLEGGKCSVCVLGSQLCYLIRVLKMCETLNGLHYLQHLENWQGLCVKNYHDKMKDNTKRLSLMKLQRTPIKGDSRTGCLLESGITCLWSSLTRLVSNRIQLICIDAERTFGGTLIFFPACEKMSWWLVQSKARIFLEPHWKFATDMWIMYS